ncbi:uncharacterized protein DUF2228 [Actinocorallia herbida]|uniref:Uncharacterized protein DUF2228 n=1 Tax=Actinocorallia herbida TaxID=58109 RepID=A0A3N1CWV0_9ACTN|nr:ADP-ribosylation family protein [Actinocorallia herbida]ROO85746.1 uncharacterized protein DUF2228 [Actinocorallia herbida]
MSDDRRRQAALATAWERFPAVAERVGRVYGLRVPRHLGVFWAFWRSADDAERAALDALGLSLIGVTDYFGDRGPRLVGRDGLDERLHGRFRQDPAEFVTVLAGHSDGLHYGLWYDDPAELPSFVVHNHARDSAETWSDGRPTLLAELRDLVHRASLDYGADSEDAPLVRPLLAALDWFAPAERDALQADGAPRRASALRSFSAVSVFPALPPDSGDPLLAESAARLKGFQTGAPEAAEWIARAERELASGAPALALAVGSELHWLDHDAYRAESRALLTAAYRSLGRDAHADLIDLHSAHRDLRSVDVLVLPAP